VAGCTKKIFEAINGVTMNLTAKLNTFVKIFKYEKHKMLSLIIVFLCSLTIAVLFERYNSLSFPYIWSLIGTSQLFTEFFSFSDIFSLFFLYRFILFFSITFFILLHFIINISVFYDIVYRYRYLIAVLLFLVLVINKVHFSSVAMFNAYIQPGYGSDFINPFFNNPHPIRSDEWLVTTPVQLSAGFGTEPLGRFNDVLRGTATVNMPNGVAINLASLAFPMSLFYIFGAEYFVSARWVGFLIITFMVSFEFSYIISGKKRLIGAVGACLITFSPFFQWWSYVYFITSGLGALVCLYYFINSETTLKKLLLSFGVVMFISQFIVTLYPAWQVPAGYLYFGIAVWMVAANWNKVKTFKKIDYGIIALGIVLIATVVGTYVLYSREYIEAISNTVYPGTRISTGGELSIRDFANRTILGGIFGPLEASRVVTGGSNVCEFGGFFTLFPVPLLFVSYMIIKKRVPDFLSIFLIAFSLILGSYVFIGWPEWLSKLTLMSFSISTRAIDIIIFAQVFLLIRAMSRFTKVSEEENNRLKTGLLAWSTVIGFCMIIIVERLARKTFIILPDPIYPGYLIASFIGFTAIIYSLLDFQRNKKIFTFACLYMIILSCITWFNIHPMSKGLDVIYSKPLSAKISELATDTDEKWVSLQGIVGSSYLIANGASTITSVNIYPNLDLWYKLDPDRIYENEYNRYAVITAELTGNKTSFALHASDHMHIKLSYDDLKQAGVKYIHTTGWLDWRDDIKFDLIYNEGGARIYSVNYED